MKLVVYDPFGRKITAAPRTETARNRAWVVKVITALGHPEAWITDLSIVGDFDKFPMPKTLCNMKVTANTKIITVAKHLRRVAKKKRLATSKKRLKKETCK
jgi:hypothetical protein